MTNYFNLAISDTMFNGNVSLKREVMLAADFVDIVNSCSDIVSAANKYHESTLDVLFREYGLIVTIPEEPPKIRLQSGDVLYLASVTGLPRGVQREFTRAEVESATFTFCRWTVE